MTWGMRSLKIRRASLRPWAFTSASNSVAPSRLAKPQGGQLLAHGHHPVQAHQLVDSLEVAAVVVQAGPGDVGEPSGVAAHGRVELVAGHDLVDDAPRQGPLGRDPAAGKQHLVGPGPSDGERQHQRRRPHPEGGLGVSEEGVVGANDQVAAGGQVKRPAHAGATHRGDSRDGRGQDVPESVEAVGHLHDPLAQGLGPVRARHVEPGRERPTGTLDHHRMDVVALAESPKGGAQLQEHGRAERVQLGGTVEPDAADPVALADHDEGLRLGLCG